VFKVNLEAKYFGKDIYVVMNENGTKVAVIDLYYSSLLRKYFYRVSCLYCDKFLGLHEKIEDAIKEVEKHLS